MKSLYTLIALSTLTITSLYGQSQKEHKVPLSTGLVQIVDLDEVVVQGYAGSEVIVTSVIADSEISERAMGLRLVNHLGLNDNTGMGLAVTRDANVVTITQIDHDCDCDEVVVQVPHGVNIELAHSNSSADNITLKDVKDEVVVTTNYHDINFENVTGPMAIKTVYGSIEGVFSEVSQSGSISIYSVYDLVDLTLPSSTKANVNISSPYGNVYTDLEIMITDKPDKNTSTCSSVNPNLGGTLNGGGVELTVKSAYDNIYLRKKM